MPDYAPRIERLFGEPPPEQCSRLEDIAGEIPEFVRGTYYMNGPARFSRGDFQYRHWLDGDGMVGALRVGDGRAHFTSRWVRSAKLCAEQQAGRPLFRTFGTAFAGDRLKRGVMLASPVNVSVYRFAGALLAFGEQGLPWELDPITLETRREVNFGGALNEVSPFAAHPKLDSRTGEMFNFGVGFSEAQPSLNVYRFSPEGRLLYRRRLPLPYSCAMHDFGLSRRYAVFYVSPYILRIAALARDGAPLIDALRWEPERGSSLLIVARDTGEPVALLPVGHGYCLHFINCFEQGHRLLVDVLRLDRPVYDQYQPLPDLFADVGPGHPVRFVVDPRKHEIQEEAEIDFRTAPDFASIPAQQAGEPYQDFWMLGISATGRRGRKFFDQLARANWSERAPRDVYQAPPGRYLGGEPTFIPDPHNADRGAVICQLLDADGAQSAFAVFDAFDVARGPVAQLRVPGTMHAGFHAAFYPGPAPARPA